MFSVRLFGAAIRPTFSLCNSFSTSSSVFAPLKFTKTHEWVDIKGNVATVGITDFAQHKLGDIVYVDVPNIGDPISLGASLAQVESVKAAADVYAPIEGKVVEKNAALDGTPSLVNSEAETSGWIARIEIGENPKMTHLLEEKEYRALCDAE